MERGDEGLKPLGGAYLSGLEEVAAAELDEAGRVAAALKGQGPQQMVAIAQLVTTAFRAGKRLYAFGNGGSASDAQHLVAELVGRFRRERMPLPAVALTANSSSLTAIANDYAYDQVFARPLQALVQEGDVAAGFSTSGHSPNVLQALAVAREAGARTLLFTGAGAPQALPFDQVLRVPSQITARIQEGHIVAVHIICELIDRVFA